MDQATKVMSIKELAESRSLTSVPSEYTYTTTNQSDQADQNDPDHSIPIVDFALLTSDSHDQCSKALCDLRKACEDWGVFLLINHGVSENVMKRMIEASEAFFDLAEEEKKEFQGTSNVLDPIKCGTSFNIAIDKVLLWRDFIKIIAHPQFNSPHKPVGFSEAALEFSEKIRELATELMKSISETLGLESNYIDKAMNWERGLQLMAANYYPMCPEPNRAIGIPPHSDHGLITFLIQNGVDGLQVQHKAKWVNCNSISNSNAFVVNLADQMQVLTNDKYKSALHRAVVNDKATRISIAVAHGPAVDTVVVPSPELLEQDGQSSHFSAMSYEDYIKLQQSSKSYMKSTLDLIRI